MKQKVLEIQSRLSDLKQDRSRFLTVTNVLELYSDFDSALKGMSTEEISQLKPILTDSVLLFSLAFSTLGYTRQPIAVYAKAVTLLTLFRFIRWDPSLTPKELVTLQSSVTSVEDCLHGFHAEVPDVPYVTDEIARIVDELHDLYGHIADTMATLPEEEYPVYSQITHLRRDILAEVSTGEFSADRLAVLEEKLSTVKIHAEGGVHHNDDYEGGGVSELCAFQLEKTCILVEWFQTGASLSELEINDKELVPIFNSLREMLPVLDVFVMTRRWTLRVTDLYQYMDALLKMIPKMLFGNEEMRSIREHVGKLRSTSDQKYHYLVTYMARRAWALIFKLLDTTEPVSEALSALYNQLLTMKRCLGEVQLAGGISNLRELYPYQMKLASLDNLRQDGKFFVDNEVPPGQGVLNGMLAECFDMMYELKVELDEKGEADDSVVADDETETESELLESEMDTSKSLQEDEGFRSEVDVSSKALGVTHDSQPEDQIEDQLDNIPEARE